MNRRSANAALSNNDAVVPATKRDQECQYISWDCEELTAPTRVCVYDNARPKQQSRRLWRGKTAKNHVRHFVVHDYHDHSQEKVPCCCDSRVALHQGCCIFSAATTLFPMKLHIVLQDVANERMEHIVSWAPHGRCFLVHKPQEFVDKILPR
jgi:HSF-type DNA-binding